MKQGLATLIRNCLTGLVLACVSLYADTTPQTAGSSNFGLQTPEVQPATTPTPAPQPQERRKGQGNASAMAMAAAGIQAMSCMMLMKEAMNAQGSEKTMLMAMAMQQCAQAAQSLQNGKDNKDGENKLAQGDNGPKPAGIKAQPFNPPTAPTEAKPEQAAETAAGEPITVPDAQDAKTPETKEAQSTPSEITKTANPQPVGVSVPNRIDTAKLGYDDTGKSSQAETPSRDLAFGTSIVGGGKLSDPQNPRAALEGFVPIDAKRTRASPGEGESLGGSDGGQEASKGGGVPSEGGENGGNGALDAMLAMLGGPAGAPGQAPATGSDILRPPTEKAGERRSNIFEYASGRYHQAVDEGRVRTTFRLSSENLVDATSMATFTAR